MLLQVICRNASGSQIEIINHFKSFSDVLKRLNDSKYQLLKINVMR